MLPHPPVANEHEYPKVRRDKGCFPKETVEPYQRKEQNQWIDRFNCTPNLRCLFAPMISWIQDRLIRHGRWIFLTLLTVIIVTFVFTTGNTPGCTTDRSAYRKLLYYGIDMNSPLERDVLLKKLSLSAFLNDRQAPDNQSLEIRIALLHLADTIGVGTPDQETLADYIETKVAFLDENNVFSPDKYTSFVDQVNSNPEIPQGLVITVLEEDYRIRQIASVIAGPGYLLPSEVKTLLQRNRTRFTVATAESDYAAFSPEMEPTEEELRTYYNMDPSRYEQPEQIRAGYVFFQSDLMEDPLELPSETDLREHFIANRSQFIDNHTVADTSEKEKAGPTHITYSDVRDAVAADFLAEQKAQIANRKAHTFALTLYNDSIQRDSPAFNELLNEYGLQLIEIEPYAATDIGSRKLPTEMLKSAFRLGGNRYYSDPYPLDGGYGLLISKGRIPSKIPSFETVKDAVTEDYTVEKKRLLFNEKGESLKADLESAIDKGTDFVKAAEALGLRTRSYETFSAEEAPEELNPKVFQQLYQMRSGEISPMLLTGPTGIFAYLEDADTPEIASDDEALIQAKEQLKHYSTNISALSYSSELVSRGLPEKASSK